MSESLKEALELAGITKEKVEAVQREALRGFVYVIKCNEYYKIGCSREGVEKRLKAMQTGNPYELELIMMIKTSNYPKTELFLHKRFDKYRIRGEWFKLSEELINELYTYIDGQTRQKLSH